MNVVDRERFEPTPICWDCHDDRGGCPECLNTVILLTKPQLAYLHEVTSLPFAHVTEKRARHIAKLLAADIGLLTADDCERACNDHLVDIKLARRILMALAKAGIHPPAKKAQRER